MRAAFENWVKATGYSTDWSRFGGPNTDGDYLKPRVQDAWRAWQAAHERCAKIAERMNYGGNTEYDKGRTLACQDIAHAIRDADKRSSPQTGET